MSILSKLERACKATAITSPRGQSFRQFLETEAMVPADGGLYVPWTFNGRESVSGIVDAIDDVFRNGWADASICVAGGAQWGKTVLELYLMAYCTSSKWFSCGCYLPDDGLADAIVDTKFRPVVLDNVPWFAQMTQVGRAVNKSGKSVNTKGAFLCTDGVRKSVGMFRGLKKIPTSFSMDVVIEDEKDDIPRDKAKYLAGRMTASKLRFHLIVGTQRIHGAGQNREWELGSQGVVKVKAGSEWLNPEDEWPAICRLQTGHEPQPDDPILTHSGDFRRGESLAAVHSPTNVYYLASPRTGVPLERQTIRWHHRNPNQIQHRRWSFRVSQIGIPAIDLTQIVSHWARACNDSEEMTSFCCDRLAKPKSTAQSITPAILQRAREVAPFDMLS